MPTIPAGLEPFMLAASYGHTVLLAVAIWWASGRAGLASAQRAAAGVLNRGDLTMTRKKLNRPFATGGQIAAARVVLGLSQVEVAKLAGCRQGTVSYVENSPTMRRTKARMQIIRVLAAKGLDPRNIDFDAPPEPKRDSPEAAVEANPTSAECRRAAACRAAAGCRATIQGHAPGAEGRRVQCREPPCWRGWPRHQQSKRRRQRKRRQFRQGSSPRLRSCRASYRRSRSAL